VSLMEKPGVLEKLGSALNSSDLSPVEGRTGAVELIGALGYTQINPDAVEHGEHELAAIDPRTEVGALLVRIKYGGDRALTERAVRLLIAWVHHQRAYRKWKLRAGGEGLLEKFVRTGFGEWLDPVCRLCCGREMLGLERGAIKSRRVRCTRCGGAGSLELMPRNPKFTGTKGARGYSAGPATRAVRRPCTACHGMGGVTIAPHGEAEARAVLVMQRHRRASAERRRSRARPGRRREGVRAPLGQALQLAKRRARSY
jgi:hypothetical protein